MHIQCPSCQTVFAVEDKEISAGKGRQVRCSICDHIWTASRQDALTSKTKIASSVGQTKRKWLIILILVLGLMLGGAVIWRNIVSAMFPSVIGIYTALDLSVLPDVSTIAIRDIRGERQGDTVRIR
ncbi:MAG: MJ0042-type zinc finger domain-containing protein, partial [Candidatus Puniceispirillales bacterium]